MGKKDNVVYAPGELGRVRDKLGVTDAGEAKRMAQLLGGEVGVERSTEADAAKPGRTRRETVELVVGGKNRKRPGRRIETAEEEDEEGKSKQKSREPEIYPGDDPALPLYLGYRERVKMDQFAGQFVFEIKNTIQVLTSIISFFKTPVDYVNPRFVTKRMNEYYAKLEKLVTLTRNLFPKTNAKRNNQLKRASPHVYRFLDTIKSWNIEKIAAMISGLQARPRTVRVSDFTEILQEVYRPLFLLSDLSAEDIKTAFKLVYKVLYLESPLDAKEKYQAVIRNIILSVIEVRRDVHFGMYPLLMKLISDRFIPYNRFFIERRFRLMAFLVLRETDKLNAEDFNPQNVDSINVEALPQDTEEENPAEEPAGEEASTSTEDEDSDTPIEEDPDDPKVIERIAKEEARKAEVKAVEQAQTALEALFPKAGWQKMEEYPDFFPYFANMFNLKGGYELIAPTDPLQQVSILMHILDDFFIGLRSVNFGKIINSDNTTVQLNEELVAIIHNWRAYIDEAMTREYFPRLIEYCNLLENSRDARSSPYGKKKLNELHWVKRLYFLPYYKFDTIGPPPLQKNEVIPIYSQVRRLRQYLTAIAAGIEQGVAAGGAAEKAQCEGIHNPWNAYNFQVPNPVSRRMNLLLPPERKINATLILFSLSTVTLLDYIINNESSWAYGGRPGPLVRSVRDEGITPVYSVNKKLDADQIFKDSLKKSE